jgi:hypothetical protein
MSIHQISVFVENKFGKLNEVLSLIAHEDIRIISASLADTSEFGILRLIVTDPHKACQIFKKNNVNIYLTEVLAIVTDAKAGQFAETIGYFTQSGISIEYMYCFSIGGKGILVMRPNNQEAALDVVRKKGLACVSESELMSF